MIDARNQLEQLIYTSKKMPDEFKDKISDEDKKAIEGRAGEKLTSEDKDELEEATKTLSERVQSIGAKLISKLTRQKVNRGRRI